jgi:NADH-quinone oxidoreductase subunit F
MPKLTIDGKEIEVPVDNAPPCREGSGWIYRIFQRIYQGEGRPQDLENLPDIIGNVGSNTICAFGDAVTMSVGSYVQKFRQEFEYHIKEKKCEIC